VGEILKKFGYPQLTPVVVFTDSANARIYVLNPIKGARTRYIDIKYK